MRNTNKMMKNVTHIISGSDSDNKDCRKLRSLTGLSPSLLAQVGEREKHVTITQTWYTAVQIVTTTDFGKHVFYCELMVIIIHVMRFVMTHLSANAYALLYSLSLN